MPIVKSSSQINSSLSDIAAFMLKRDVKLQPTNQPHKLTISLYTNSTWSKTAFSVFGQFLFIHRAHGAVKVSPRTVSAIGFWATVCKAVRPILPGPLSVLSVCLSVTLVYCDQTVGWIKMKLNTEISLGPGHIVLDWDPAPSPKGVPPANFRPMSVVAKGLDGSRYHLVRSYALAQATLC